MTIPFHVLVNADGTRRVCVMNCGQTIGDKRSREDIMRECDDCVDYPCPPPNPKVRIGMLEAEIAHLRVALRNVLHSLDAGTTRGSIRCTVEGILNDSDARLG